MVALAPVPTEKALPVRDERSFVRTDSGSCSRDTGSCCCRLYLACDGLGTGSGAGAAVLACGRRLRTVGVMWRYAAGSTGMSQCHARTAALILTPRSPSTSSAL